MYYWSLKDFRIHEKCLCNFTLVIHRLSLILVVLLLPKFKREAKTFGPNLSCMLQIFWLGWLSMLLW